MSILISVLMACGLVSEIIGAVLMARQFANVPWRQLTRVLLSALARGETAQGIGRIAELSGEKPIEIVQGLAFVCLGISIKLFAELLELSLKLMHSS
jgi:hypothetical protein